MDFRTDLRHRVIAPAALLLALTAAAGCGGSDNSSNSGSNSSSSSQEAARVKFAQCLRENGIDIPDNARQGGGGGAPRNIDQEKFRKAQEACQEYQQAAVPEISDEQRQEFQDAFAKFASCMREHGVDLPSGGPGGGGGPPAGGAGIDQDDPKVQAAQEACQDVLPQGGRFGGPGGPGGG